LRLAVIFLFLIIGIYVFFNSLHNLDLAQNWRFVNAEYDLNLAEHNIWTEEATELTTLYSKGYKGVIIGFFITLFSSLILGFNYRREQ